MGPLSYVYFEGELGRRSAAKLLTKDEARGSLKSGALTTWCREHHA